MTLHTMEKPILLGRLGKSSNFCTLSGYLGDIESITSFEYQVLREMNGLNTFAGLSQHLSIPVENIQHIYQKFAGNKKLTTLSQWNQIGWCPQCYSYVAGATCDICHDDVEKMDLNPPCDPWICFEVERKFIIDMLFKAAQIVLHEDTFFLANNCIANNKFYWEIIYRGKKIAHIHFPSYDSASWKCELLVGEREIMQGRPHIWGEDTIPRMIQANESRQAFLFHNSAAFIESAINYYESTPLLYFSGGKESMVIYSLLERLQLQANVLTVATGVDFPEDLAFMREFGRIIQDNPLFTFYFFEENGEDVIRYLNEKKNLSAKEPWCRISFKKALKNKATDEIYHGEDFIAFEGTRWYETDFRRGNPKMMLLREYPHQIWACPIIEWTAFDVWIYTYANNLQVNPMYNKGFQKTTCWLCPVVSTYSYVLSQTNYPDLWAKIQGCELTPFGDSDSRDVIF